MGKEESSRRRINRITFPFMLTLYKLDLVSDHYMSTEYYIILFGSDDFA